MQKLEEYKQTLQAKQAELARLEGKQESLLDELKTHGFEDFDSLEDELVTLDKEIEVLEKNQEKAMLAFEEKYAELLEE